MCPTFYSISTPSCALLAGRGYLAWHGHGAAQGADIQQAYAEMWGKVSSLRKDGKWNQMPPILRERRNQIWSFRWFDGSCSCSETVGPNSALIKSLMLQGDKHDLLNITGMKQEHRRSHRNNSLSSSMNTVEFYWGGLRDVPWVSSPQSSHCGRCYQALQKGSYVHHQEL